MHLCLVCLVCGVYGASACSRIGIYSDLFLIYSRRSRVHLQTLHFVQWVIVSRGWEFSFCQGKHWCSSAIVAIVSPRSIIPVWLPFIHLCVCVCVWARARALAECLQVLFASPCACSHASAGNAGKCWKNDGNEEDWDLNFHLHCLRCSERQRKHYFYWDWLRRASPFPWEKPFGGYIWNQ